MLAFPEGLSYSNLLIEELPHPVLVLSTQNELLYKNKKFYEYFGENFEISHLVSFLESKTLEQICRLMRSDGELRWNLLRSESLKTASSHLGCLLSFTDIQQQKENEISLLSAIKARDDFISIAAHELKTPLTALSLQNQMRQRSLKKKVPRDYSKEDFLRMMEAEGRQIERLTGLIDDLMDVSRINSGKMFISPIVFDLCELTNEVVDTYNQFAVECGSQLHVSTEKSIVGTWDRVRLEQVIKNLLMNALKYGAGKPIFISAKQESTWAFIEIRDGGRGIAEADQERIFQRFERASDKDEVSGLGLGLYIAREIVELHKGYIQVQSQLGAGAKFTVKVPLNP